MLILMNVETADLTGEEMKQMLQSDADGARTRIFHALYATPELDQKIYLDKTPSNFVFGADLCRRMEQPPKDQVSGGGGGSAPYLSEWWHAYGG